MSVLIGHGARSDTEVIVMRNGLMSVFVGVLAIAASSLAQSERERLIASWIASHDQNVFGLGVVDFDVSDIPWEHATFDQDKKFILSVIQAAISQHEWSKLGYNPRLDCILDCLSRFEKLVQLFLENHVLPAEEQKWWFGQMPTKLEQCQTHGVYLHSHGCVLCNDTVVDPE